MWHDVRKSLLALAFAAAATPILAIGVAHMQKSPEPSQEWVDPDSLITPEEKDQLAKDAALRETVEEEAKRTGISCFVQTIPEKNSYVWVRVSHQGAQKNPNAVCTPTPPKK